MHEDLSAPLPCRAGYTFTNEQDGQALRAPGGLSICPGWRGRGDPPPASFCSLRVGIIPITILKRWRG